MNERRRDSGDSGGHGYRDDLAAAHERIAELEALLAEKLGEKPEWVAEKIQRLEDERVWLRGTAYQQRTLAMMGWAVGLVVGAFLAFGAFNSRRFLMPFAIYGFVGALVASKQHQRRQTDKREVALRIDRLGAEIAGLLASQGAAARGKIRIAAESTEEASAIDAEFGSDEPLSARRPQS